MAKKSHKRPVRLKKDNAGCMSGLISIFDFRQGRFTQRLLSDKSISSRNGGAAYSRSKIDLRNLEEKQEIINDDDGNGEGSVSGKASIKALMAEEMSATQNSKKFSSSKVEQLRAELESHEKNHREINKIHRVGSRRYSNDAKASQSTRSDLAETSSFNTKLEELMLEFNSESKKCQEKGTESVDDDKIDELDPHYIFKKALCDIKEALLTDMSADSEQITSCHAVQPKDFIDALDTLSSNKEAFLKLVQDPDSLLFQQILDLQIARPDDLLHGSKPEEHGTHQLSHKQSRHSIFRRKDKSEEAKLSSKNTSQDLKRIVVLKPNHASHQEYLNTISPISSPYHNLQHHDNAGRVSFNFSLKEIKRRLKNVIGENRKDRHLIAMDGILHKVPYGFKREDENGKTCTSTDQQSSRLSKFLRRGSISSSLKGQSQKKMETPKTAEPSAYRESVFYEEARKRLAEMIGSSSQNEVSSRHVSKQLGRILSMPGYNSLSPLFSPGREEINSPRSNRISSLQKTKRDESSASMNNTEKHRNGSFPCSDWKPDEELQLNNKKETLAETQLDVEEDLMPKGSSETEEGEGSVVQAQFSAREPDFISERCNLEGSCTSSDSLPFREQTPTPCISIPPDSLLAQKFQSSEKISADGDRPSPASVLEPFFSGINSPEAAETDQAEWIIEPRQLSFEEAGELILTSTVPQANLLTCTEDKVMELQYVRAVLEASGLIYNQLLPERCQSSDQLLDPFVYDEVEISYGQQIQDLKLLFDCINEVLVEIQKRYLHSNPWISFIRPSTRPIPTGEKFVQEVYREIDWHLSSQFPCTLDQVVRKDLEGGNWMNVRLETEGAVFDIGEVILEYIMEETILELWE